MHNFKLFFVNFYDFCSKIQTSITINFQIILNKIDEKLHKRISLKNLNLNLDID